MYVVDADGSGLRRLASGIAGSWSRDGTKIVYAASYPGHLTVMNADGSGKRRLRGAFGADPHWR